MCYSTVKHAKRRHRTCPRKQSVLSSKPFLVTKFEEFTYSGNAALFVLSKKLFYEHVVNFGIILGSRFLKLHSNQKEL